jgi:heme O synthase-like polyprenyltransferase
MAIQRKLAFLFVTAVSFLRPVSGFSHHEIYGKLPVIQSRHPGKIFTRASVSADQVVTQAIDTRQSTRKERMYLYAEMCRLDNLPASFFFVAGGAVAATNSVQAVMVSAVLLVALCTMMITATSMVANDYFDYKKGTDAADTGNALTRQALKPEDAKAFVGKCYTLLLLLICVVPEAPVRILLMAGGISTFTYTKRFKPVTWLKNASVAFICALAPAVSHKL